MDGCTENGGNWICYYLSTDGDDTNKGTLEQPFRTLAGARNAVRKHLVKGLESDIIVYIRGGKYYVDTPVVFTERDSGTNGYSVIYRNYPGETPVFEGGIRITGWVLDDEENDIYKAYVGGNHRFNTMYENNQRSVKARMPKKDYAETQAVFNNGDKIDIVFKEGDLPGAFNIENAQVFIWGGSLGDQQDNWFSDTIPIIGADFENRTLALKCNTWWDASKGNRFFVQGSRDFLDSRGEMYLDEAGGTLYYKPRSNPIGDQDIVIPVVKRVIEITGSSMASTAHDIVFDGLVLSTTDFDKEYNRKHHNDNEGIIYLENAESITIKNCTISNAGHNGIAICRYAQKIRVENNTIENCGMHGIYLSGYTAGQGPFSNPQEAYVNKNNAIIGNVIRNCGQLVGQGTGILLHPSGDNIISHNKIYNISRQGISLIGLSYGLMRKAGRLYGIEVTWDNHWDFAYTRNNLIEYNEIYNAMTDTSDGGAINSFGTGSGNIINNNYVHDIKSVPGGICMGIYLDDASNRFKVTNNIVSRVGSDYSRMAFAFCLKGVDIELVNNIIANCKTTGAVLLCESPLEMYEGGNMPAVVSPTENIIIKRNIIFEKTTDGTGMNIFSFMYYKTGMIKESDYNVYCFSSGQYSVNGIGSVKEWDTWRSMTWTEWMDMENGRHEAHTIFADPMFRDPENDDYTLLPGSPAFAVGFRQIDMSCFKQGEK